MKQAGCQEDMMRGSPSSQIVVENPGTGSPTQGRHKCGPYGWGVASVGIEEHFATGMLTDGELM